MEGKSDITKKFTNCSWQLKHTNTDDIIKWEILSRTQSKFNTKLGCRFYNLVKVEKDKSDKTK